MATIQRNAKSTVVKAPREAALTGRMDRLRVRHLRLMDLIARLGSLSAAAQALHVSQPGATKMLQEVEAAFGQTLIERTTKGGRLTASGLNVLDRLRIAVQAVACAGESMQDHPELPLLRLGVLPFVGVSALCSVVSQLLAQERLPRIQIRQGTVESLLLALRSGEVDCAVTVMEVIDQADIFHQLDITPLWEEALVVVAGAGHPILRRKALSVAQLRDQDWILMPHGTSNRRNVEQVFLRAGMPPPVARIETESFHIGMSLVAGSRMISAVPYSAYVQYASRVKPVPMTQEFQTGAVVFVTLAGMPRMPAVQDLARCFQLFASTYPPPV